MSAEICPYCRKRVRTVIPAGGDGSAEVFVRHDVETLKRCSGSRCIVEPQPRKQTSGTRHCQISTTGQGLPCFANINTLAGLDEACEVCAPNLQKMRDLMEWQPFREKFFMSSKLAGFQHDALLDRINAETTT